MEAFDQLPEKVRVALNFSAANHSARECLRFINMGISEDDLVGEIVRTDARMVRREYHIGR